ncbi:hypothetical protein [Tropicibacter sp. S64]|uniref:hypothetical protein n=1 Tax=Tropicibacter sp. S64 TaxID=3415122 RepID=UPI003C7BD4F7
MIANRRPPDLENAVLLVGDHNWRKGPKWKAALAWLFGERELFRTHKGDVAELSWWRGEPFLITLEDDPWAISSAP